MYHSIHHPHNIRCVTTEGNVFYRLTESAEAEADAAKDGWVMERHPAKGSLLLLPCKRPGES